MCTAVVKNWYTRAPWCTEFLCTKTRCTVYQIKSWYTVHLGSRINQKFVHRTPGTLGTQSKIKDKNVSAAYTWTKKVRTPYTWRPELGESWYTWAWPLAARCTIISGVPKNYGTPWCTVYRIIIPALPVRARTLCFGGLARIQGGTFPPVLIPGLSYPPDEYSRVRTRLYSAQG